MVLQGRFDDAAAWAIRATGEPHAHFHIHAIAAACLALAGRAEEARAFARHACRAHPGYSVRVFERSFPHRGAAQRALISGALRSAGVPDGEP